MVQRVTERARAAKNGARQNEYGRYDVVRVKLQLVLQRCPLAAQVYARGLRYN